MQRFLRPLSAVLLCLLGGMAQAAGPSSTGLAADGTPLSPGAVDAHYTVTGGDLTDAPTYVAQNPAGYPGYWPKNDDLSGWITPALTSNGDAAGQPDFIFTYTTRFDLTGYDASTARVDGQLAVDDSLRAVLLNGQDIGFTANGYSSFKSFAITSGFLAGVNTLSFVTRNDNGGPTGLRVELASTLVPVPEPAAALLMAGGCGVLLLRRRLAAHAAA